MSRLKAHRGFTLAELLVALGISGLLATIALPGFASLRRTAALGSTADALLAALHQAQSAAARRAVPVALCLSQDGARCVSSAGMAGTAWLVFFDHQRESPVQLSAADELIARLALPAGVQISGSRPAVTYWPVARAGTTATFAICDARDRSHGRTVVVSQTGRPRVTPEDTAGCSG